jgi:DNA-binding CsgD family transcriptional regulator
MNGRSPLNSTPADSPHSQAACRLRTVCEQAGVTEQEHEVCHWLMQGKTNVEIAAILSIAPQAAEKHIQLLLGKLGVGNRTAATLELIRRMRQPEA